jgi:uncharacterized protein (DUF2249 family)/iron-sulfur cluster repair protein YtfE (RIC family)
MREANEASQAIREHHQRIREELSRRVDAALGRGARGDLDALVALLEGDLLEHARAEQAHLYPLIDGLVCAHSRPTATMDIDHEAIAAAVGKVAIGVERMRVSRERQDRMDARGELREALLRLDTLLDVHLTKEERVYLPLLEAHVPPERQAALLDQMREPALEAPSGDTVVDAREIPQRERHARIFAAFDHLAVGESFVLVSDHDPRPLSYQFSARHPDAYAWQSLQRGPLWRVRITRTRPA